MTRVFKTAITLSVVSAAALFAHTEAVGARQATERTVYVSVMDGNGAPVATHDVAIPCGGSLHWRYTETFTAAERKSAGDGAYVLVRDQTCRLFGYHGLVNGAGSFSLDHMFGF